MQCPIGAKGGIGICPYVVSEIISSDLDESQMLIFWCKKHRFCGSTEDCHPCNTKLFVLFEVKRSMNIKLDKGITKLKASQK